MKSILKLMFTASVSIAILASCSKDDPTSPTTPPDNPDPVRVELNLKAEDMKTRAIDENSIFDVNVYCYSKSNGVDYHFYQADYASAMTFNLLPGKYDLFVVVNANKDLGEMSQSDLYKYEFSKGGMKDNIPMTANTEVNVLAATTLPTLSVRRVAAKIAYSVTVDDTVAENIKLRSIQFMSVPSTAVLFSERNTSTDETDFYNEATVVTNNVKTYSDTYYMFENCQGTVESITDPIDKAPENAPACATYMRILADGPEKLLEYIVYLGENSTSNFDVRRNTKHTMNLYIKGENEIDNRVSVYEGLYYGKANCHMCTGMQVSFDATPYRTGKSQLYAYTDIYAGEEYEAAKAELLWEDVKGLVTNVSFNANNVTVTTTGVVGNAVVALYDKTGNIIWSFHIWCTEQPQLMYFRASLKNSNNRYVAMDRLLGAHEMPHQTIQTGNKGKGLVYQFGRKDPFPSYDWDLGEASIIYDRNGEEYIMNFGKRVDKKQEDATFGYCGSIGYAIAHPMLLIISYDAWGGWVYPFDYNTNAILWGNALPDAQTYPDMSSLHKTVYDPCPEGYMIPSTDAFTDMYNQYQYYDIDGVRQYIYMHRTRGYDKGGSIYNSNLPEGCWYSGCYGNGTSIYPTRYTVVNAPNKHLCESVAVRCVKE